MIESEQQNTIYYLHTDGAALRPYGSVASHPVQKIWSNRVAWESRLVLWALPVSREVMMMVQFDPDIHK